MILWSCAWSLNKKTALADVITLNIMLLLLSALAACTRKYSGCAETDNILRWQATVTWLTTGTWVSLYQMWQNGIRVGFSLQNGCIRHSQLLYDVWLWQLSSEIGRWLRLSIYKVFRRQLKEETLETSSILPAWYHSKNSYSRAIWNKSSVVYD